MPCVTEPDEYDDRRERADAQDKSTRLLCALLRQVEKALPSIILDNKELSEWWIKHKDFDKRRGR